MPEKIYCLEKAQGKATAQACRRLRYHFSFMRLPRLLLLLITLLAVKSVVMRLIQDHRDYTLRRMPTDFTALVRQRQSVFQFPSQPIRRRNATHIDDLYTFVRELGKGKQGSTALYIDGHTGGNVVVKSFTVESRNPIPADLVSNFATFSTKWPSEIEASLLLGYTENDENLTVYVPVIDYFIQKVDTSSWSWAMVTPFVENGTLLDLASSLRTRTPDELDKIFRPVLNEVGRSLNQLHEAGYCHNDIKPDNIFVANSTHWLLGDLGSVRQVNHPWHKTRRIRRENQLHDCKLNDVRRLLKTYMQFLRAACDASSFNRAFYQVDQAWSKLYWGGIAQRNGSETASDVNVRMSEELDSA